MNLQHTKSLVIAAMAATFLASCETPSALVTVPVENVDSNPLKVSALTESEKQAWSSRDLRTDTIPGMSVDRTYAEILPGKSGQQVIVAVIDSGIDINHEDLKGRIWTNPKEIAGNGKDDDNNGYIDDIHGWNFLGDVGAEQLEFVRIIKRFESEFAGKTLATIPASQKDIFLQYQKAKAEYDEKVAGAQRQKTQYEQIASQLKSSHPAIVKALGKEDYTQADLATIKNPSAEMQNHLGFITQMFQYTESIPDFMKNIDEGVEYFTGQLEANYNKTADFRKVLGDDPYDITDTKYGNNNVYGPEPDGAKHGTHVAGIIAATRNNGKGMNGVANSNIKIMAVRAVPDGDEYDKDIALAIRYAVDNGAKVINTSFGKYYSQNPEWVYEAIKYAAKNDVLIVNAAGNEGLSLDDPANRVYPNDQLDNVTEMADTFLTIGALAPKYGSQLLANFSNYGKSNVDVFAPGVDIYSTTPEDTYEYLGGTSMAAPNTAGVAAMLRSYYPKLSANEVKNIIMKSGLTTNTSVILGGDTEKQARFNEVSKSGEMVNMYNAFKLAELQK
ncbi:S8 family peptidase [Dokdonia sp. Dokd-P16]|uniref:S8 family peptidase n=1 Tax=Dokdonia sp. Dokd-P16 TaxID=2173169 RepID=UPI001EF38C85